MACFRPVAAFLTPDGSVDFTGRVRGSSDLKIPCGRCVGCRIARSRSWALRCVHEAKLHDQNAFVTLTYDDDHLPAGGSLRYRDFQLFMKRLRKVARSRIRFFMAGEYGEQLLRPHYHACLFGYWPADAQVTSVMGSPDRRSWRSSFLERTWPHGTVHIGELNYTTASYAASYIFKSVTGDLAESHYRVVDADGVIHQLAPEFCVMSRRPGIGTGFLQRYVEDVYRGDYVVHDGKKFPVPRFYDRKLKQWDPERLQDVKSGRQERVTSTTLLEETPSRLEARETVAAAGLQQKSRSMEKFDASKDRVRFRLGR